MDKDPKQYGHYEEGVDSDHYATHVFAMTAEKLHGKSEIAAELAYRDSEIQRLEAREAELVAEVERIKRPNGAPSYSELQKRTHTALPVRHSTLQGRMPQPPQPTRPARTRDMHEVIQKWIDAIEAGKKAALAVSEDSP